mmetsp:Transcript_7485/g.31156  ORF Transcript_7485/g.31156 Transcript_7485/m.31156 type:complete len:230 (+) Transcript_7485:531-1220(+)
MAPEGTAHVAKTVGARAGKARRARAQSVVRVTPAVASAEREEDDFGFRGDEFRRGDARRGGGGKGGKVEGLRRPREPARRGRLRVDLRGARGPAPGDFGSGGVRAGLDHRRVPSAARPAVAVPRGHGRGGGGASRGGLESRRRSDSRRLRRRRRRRRRRRNGRKRLRRSFVHRRRRRTRRRRDRKFNGAGKTPRKKKTRQRRLDYKNDVALLAERTARSRTTRFLRTTL